MTPQLPQALLLGFLLVTTAACAAPQLPAMDRESEELAVWAIRTSWPEPTQEDWMAAAVATEQSKAQGVWVPRPARFDHPITALANRRLQAYAATMARWTRQTGREIVVLLDDQTGEQLGSMVQGTGAVTPVMRLSPLVESSRDVTVLHTHPIRGSLSLWDLGWFAAASGIRRMIAVDPWGTVYAAEKPLAWSPPQQDLARAWSEAALREVSADGGALERALRSLDLTQVFMREDSGIEGLVRRVNRILAARFGFHYHEGPLGMWDVRKEDGS